jgi:hypothetical protein
MTIDHAGDNPPCAVSDGGHGQARATGRGRGGQCEARAWEPPLRLAAPVRGFAAWALNLLVDRYGREQLVAFRRLAEYGRLHQAYLAELESSWAAIREAAEQWLAWERQYHPSVHGSRSVADTEAPPSSAQASPIEIDTTAAAHMLDVSTSRVRQLMRAGKITGRKAGRVWLVSVASLKAYKGAR